MDHLLGNPVWAALTALLICAGSAARAAQTPAEQAAMRAWVRDHITGKGAPPFSLMVGDEPWRATADGTRKTVRSQRLDAQRMAHTVVWTDAERGLRFRVEAIEYRDVPSVEWTLRVANVGASDSPILSDIRALDAELAPPAADPVTLHWSLGDSNSADSFRPVSEPLATGSAKSFAPVGGRSSDGFMPYFNVQMPEGGVALAIGWSGQWAASFDRTATDTFRLRAGLELTRLKLHPHEEIRSPRVLLTFWRGTEPLRGNQLLRSTLIQHVTPRRDGAVVFTPICGSVAEVDPDGTYEGPHVRVMKPLADVGIEVFWSDMDPQQWYPGGFPAGTGTWEPDPAKYPRGLKPIGDAARAAGLGYLLWFEPERVAPGTQIAREHPEWVSGGAAGGLFRLDIPEARRWLTDKIDAQITQAGLAWVRWDFNTWPLPAWRAADPPDRQGMTEIRHIEGLYAMWDELARRHPGMLMDICASGGRRLDIEMLSRGLPLWHSDLQCDGAHPEADQLQNAGLYRWIPLHACGVFGLEPSYAFRSAMTTGNVFALAAHAPENAEGVRRSVAVQKKLRPYVLGDFYDTLPHSAETDRWFAYQFHRQDLDAGCLLVYRRANCADAAVVLTVRGVRPSGRYRVTFEGTDERRIVSGAELSRLEVRVPEAPGSAIVVYERIRPSDRTAEKDRP